MTGLWSFTGELPTVDKTATTSLQIVNKALLDNTTNQGAATSTELNGGIVELATQIEQASTTDDGTGNKPLALYAKYSTSTPDGTSQAGLFTVISKNNGKLHQLWLDLTEAFTWSGAHIFNSTVDIEADAGANVTFNTVAYEYPSSDGSNGQVLQTSGAGVLSYTNNSAGAFTFSTTTDIVTTTSATTSPLVIPAGGLTASSTIEVWGSTSCVDSSGGAACTFELRDSAGVTMASCGHSTDSGVTAPYNFHIILSNTSTTANQGVCYSTGVIPGTTPFAQIKNTETTSSVDIAAALTLVGNITQTNGNNYTLFNMIIKATP